MNKIERESALGLGDTSPLIVGLDGTMTWLNNVAAFKLLEHAPEERIDLLVFLREAIGLPHEPLLFATGNREQMDRVTRAIREGVEQGEKVVYLKAAFAGVTEEAMKRTFAAAEGNFRDRWREERDEHGQHEQYSTEPTEPLVATVGAGKGSGSGAPSLGKTGRSGSPNDQSGGGERGPPVRARRVRRSRASDWAP